MIISFHGEFPLAGAIGFAFVAGVALLIWRRTRTRQQLTPRKVATDDIGAQRIEVHAAQSMAAENAAVRVPEDSEENCHGGGVPDGPAPHEAVSKPVAFEDSGISSEDRREAGASQKSPAEHFPEAGIEVAILTQVIEAVPVLEEADSNEEGITAKLLESVQREANEFRGNDEPVALAEPMREIKGDRHDEVEREAETEESDEPAETDRTVGQQTAERLAGKLEEDDIEVGDPAEDARRPGRYRVPVLGPGKTPGKRTPRPSVTNQEQVLELRIRGVSDRHGFCRFQIIGRRPPGASAEQKARSGRRTVVLSEVADDWYAITELNDLPVVMERGIRLIASDGNDDEIRWALSGRDLYVLAGLQGIFGFVSTARLSIGQDQIVLCRETIAAEVQAILAEAGCDGVQVHGRDDGAPSGWMFFRSVSPPRSVPQVSGDDILNIIRPIPDIELRLEGGLWLRGSTWIAGYAPQIQVAGELPPGTEVLIDGAAAEECEPRVYATSGSERVGNHVVWCAGRAVSYEICEPDVRWQEWDADGFSRPVCGAVAAGSIGRELLVSVPTSNPVLIGANPGEVFRCDRRPGKLWTGFVPFPVCWALPEDALHCDRSLRRVILMSPLPPAHWVRGFRKMSVSARVLQWCQAIRDSQRKGLALSPADGMSEQLWRNYKREAKAVWRAAR